MVHSDWMAIDVDVTRGKGKGKNGKGKVEMGKGFFEGISRAGTVAGFDGINCTGPTTFPFPSPQEIEEFG